MEGSEEAGDDELVRGEADTDQHQDTKLPVVEFWVWTVKSGFRRGIQDHFGDPIQRRGFQFPSLPVQSDGVLPARVQPDERPVCRVLHVRHHAPPQPQNHCIDVLARIGDVEGRANTSP